MGLPVIVVFGAAAPSWDIRLCMSAVGVGDAGVDSAISVVRSGLLKRVRRLAGTRAARQAHSGQKIPVPMAGLACTGGAA